MFVVLAILGFLLGSCSASASSQLNHALVKAVNNSAPVNHRIVGGSTAFTGEFPYQGLLRIRTSSITTTICGCVLIQSRWALSAATCTNGHFASNLQVTFGTNDRVSPSASSLTRTVTGVYNHPSYSSTSNEYDISLMRFDAVTFGSLIRSISLPTSTAESLSINRNLCSVSGWGATTDSTSAPPSTTLRKATIPLITNSECTTWYSSSGLSIILYSSQICAGYQSGGIDACHGDVGGPLTCSSSSGTEVLIGIYSSGNGCARAQRPGVYTRVYSYNSWIQTTIEQNTIEDDSWIQTTIEQNTIEDDSNLSTVQYPSLIMSALLALTKFYACFD